MVDGSNLGAAWDSAYEVGIEEDVVAEALGPEAVGQSSSVTPTYLRELVTELRVEPGSTLVDMGCGTGGLTLALARAANSFTVGVDISSAAVAQARRNLDAANGSVQCRFQVDDMRYPSTLPYASFDGLVSFGAAYWGDPFGVVPQWSRLLRSERAWLVMVVARILTRRTDEDARRGLQAGLFEPHAPWESALRAAGFDVEERDMSALNNDFLERRFAALMQRRDRLVGALGEEAASEYVAEDARLMEHVRRGRVQRLDLIARRES